MKIAKRVLALVMALAMTLVLAACSSELSSLSVSLDGTYSFTGDGSTSYRIEIYDASEVTGDSIPSGVYPIVRYNVTSSGSNDLSGTVTVLDSAEGVDLPLEDNLYFGTFLPVVVSLDENNSTKSTVMGETFSKSGTLSAPVVSASKTTDSKGGNWAVEVTLSTDSLNAYRSTEAVTTYEVELYDNDECSGTPIATTTLDAVEYSAGSFSGNTWTVDVPEGTVGAVTTYYVRAMANADDSVGAAASDWGEVASVDVDGEAGGSFFW